MRHVGHEGAMSLGRAYLLLCGKQTMTPVGGSLSIHLAPPLAEV